MSVKVQLYLRSVEDVPLCVDAGADFIGLVAGGLGILPDALDYASARAVLAAVPAGTMRVALSVVSETESTLEMVRAVRPDVVHLAGAPWSVAEILALRQAEPTVKIMQAIAMNTGDPLRMAREYQPVCDYYLLDTNDPDAVDVGATGLTHDWNISARLVRETNIPVILAGGLSADNVADAVRLVQPWGVDSYSHTNLPGKPVRKDPDKVRRFTANAKAAL